MSASSRASDSFFAPDVVVSVPPHWRDGPWPKAAGSDLSAVENLDPVGAMSAAALERHSARISLAMVSTYVVSRDLRRRRLARGPPQRARVPDRGRRARTEALLDDVRQDLGGRRNDAATVSITRITNIGLVRVGTWTSGQRQSWGSTPRQLLHRHVVGPSFLHLGTDRRADPFVGTSSCAWHAMAAQAAAAAARRITYGLLITVSFCAARWKLRCARGRGEAPRRSSSRRGT